MTSAVLKAVVVAAIAGGAVAADAATASASLSNLQFAFVDLDLSDGISTDASSIAPVYSAAVVNLGSDHRSKASVGSDYSVSIRRDAGNAADVVDASHGIAGVSMHSASATGSFLQHSAANLAGSFILAPGTKLQLSADVDLAVGAASPQLEAFATAFLSLGTPGSLQTFHLSENGSAGTHLETFFVNNTTAAMRGFFGAEVDTTVLAPSVVPEPGGVALLLSGLGVLGLVAARRRAARQA